jgi:hypothetical protein
VKISATASLVIGRMFVLKEQTIRWAEAERQILEHELCQTGLTASFTCRTGLADQDPANKTECCGRRR